MKQLTLALVVLFTVLSPAQALAWFGWLDRLSGPGPWDGYRLEGRLWCFMEDTTWVQAVAASDAALTATLAAAVDDKMSLENAVKSLVVPTFQATEPAKARVSQRAASASILDLFVDDMRLASTQVTANARTTENALRLGNFTRDVAKAIAGLPMDEFKVKALITMWNAAGIAWDVAADDPGVKFTPGIAINTTCATQRRLEFNNRGRKRPVAYIDFTYQHLSAEGGDPNFANESSILLQVFQPRFSWRLLAPPYDFIDAGAGIGGYRFSSDGFEKDLWGWLVEPLRLDLHGPPRWLDKKDFRRVLAATRVSAGFVLFPSGFAADAFGLGSPAISGGEAVFSSGITFDLGAFLGW